MSAVSAVGNKLLGGHPNIPGDLTEQRRGDIAAPVHGNGGAPAISVPVLHMRTALPHNRKTETFQDTADLGRFKNGERTHDQATATFCVPRNSASSLGSPSSSSMAMTSRRLAFSSSSVSACECAPGKPGTYPTSSPVTGSRSTTAVNVFMFPLFHTPIISQPVPSHA